MKIKAQIAMVMNLDKCIGCHTCSITCKNVWTNRAGAEYMYFNNVETRPGVGYPPEMKDYYEPWTYDYETLINSERKNHQPVARPRSLINQKRMEIKAGPNWEDDLAGGKFARQDYNLHKIASEITLEFQDIFMKYLPRNCNHCLNPACVAACPSGAIYKREEDGVVLVSQDGCRGWRYCIPAYPYKKVFYNWRTNKAEKCTFCYSRLENGLPTVCTDTCVGRIRYLGVILYDADAVLNAAKTADAKNIYSSVLDLIKDPTDSEVLSAARSAGISEAVLKAAEISPVYTIIKHWKLALPLHPEYRMLSRRCRQSSKPPRTKFTCRNPRQCESR